MNIAPTITQQTARAATALPGVQKPVISSDFETFLKMLTAQMQNQDPLNPTPSDELAVQLATFSSVEQQVRTNQLLEGLGIQLSGSGIAQYAAWVGMEGRAAAAVKFNGTPVTLVPKPAYGADRVELVVRNGSGREIERLSMPASSVPFAWAGVGPNGNSYLPGNYSFELVSFSKGVPVASSVPESYGRVIEARIENGTVMLMFESGALVPATQVSALRQPSA